MYQSEKIFVVGFALLAPLIYDKLSALAVCGGLVLVFLSILIQD